MFAVGDLIIIISDSEVNRVRIYVLGRDRDT